MLATKSNSCCYQPLPPPPPPHAPYPVIWCWVLTTEPIGWPVLILFASIKIFCIVVCKHASNMYVHTYHHVSKSWLCCHSNQLVCCRENRCTHQSHTFPQDLLTGIIICLCIQHIQYTQSIAQCPLNTYFGEDSCSTNPPCLYTFTTYNLLLQWTQLTQSLWSNTSERDGGGLRSMYSIWITFSYSVSVNVRDCVK